MKIRFLFLFFLASLVVSAQDQMLSVENAVFGYYQGLYPNRLSQLSWIPGTNTYSWVDKVNNVETLLTATAGDSKSRKSILTLDELNSKVQQLNKGIDAFKMFPAVSWTNDAMFRIATEKMDLIYSVATQSFTTYDYAKDAANFDRSDASGEIAYTTGNNLWVSLIHVDLSMQNNGKVTYENVAVSNDTNRNIVYGQSVHREEFGITKGTFWSPSGMLLAFYRMDQTMVTNYPIYDLTKQPAEVRMIKYPMAGATSHQVTVGVFDVKTQKVIYLKTGEPKDQYLTNIAWSPDNKFVYIAVLNRDQNHLWLNCYNASTGDFVKTLFEETNEKYVHPMHPMVFVPMHPDEFIWQSERVKGNALYLYKTDGTLIRPLIGSGVSRTNVAPLLVTDFYGVDAKGKTAYFQATYFNGIGRMICSVDLEKGNPQSLTQYDGTHAAMFSADKSFFIDDFSSLTVPHIQTLCKASGKSVSVLCTAANPLASYKKCNVRLFTITAADNTTPLWCRMILPADFDSTKKYRSLTYVYNGPNVQLVTNSWLGGSDLFLYYMAQQGFVVFTVDGRGSDGRGIDFEQATFRHLGTQEIADQQKGAEYLKKLPYVDASRMAVYGWSFGGFMTTGLMTRTPDLFKCGVAGGAVIDWSYYEVMYTERYMDTPQQNPDGYKEANLLNYNQNLKGKLLMIHGTSDDVVVWQHTLLYTQSCVSKGVQTDYYVYPGHPHNVRGKDRVHLLTKVSQYIMANT
ncbi:MAG TPA: DPP IV N-terminal domain-containing protein [Bacteroidia bacterium]|nr:DPP IV N-terminal domain-containing protein [Bacteroidia bacterium]